jgi:hypothetical protein
MASRILREAKPSECGVQLVGAQLRTAALFKKMSSCLFQVNEPENPVIEIQFIPLSGRKLASS